jgi:hypothetical protein
MELSTRIVFALALILTQPDLQAVADGALIDVSSLSLSANADDAYGAVANLTVRWRGQTPGVYVLIRLDIVTLAGHLDRVHFRGTPDLSVGIGSPSARGLGHCDLVQGNVAILCETPVADEDIGAFSTDIAVAVDLESLAGRKLVASVTELELHSREPNTFASRGYISESTFSHYLNATGWPRKTSDKLLQRYCSSKCSIAFTNGEYVSRHPQSRWILPIEDRPGFGAWFGLTPTLQLRRSP